MSQRENREAETDCSMWFIKYIHTFGRQQHSRQVRKTFPIAFENFAFKVRENKSWKQPLRGLLCLLNINGSKIMQKKKKKLFSLTFAVKLIN